MVMDLERNCIGIGGGIMTVNNGHLFSITQFGWKGLRLGPFLWEIYSDFMV